MRISGSRFNEVMRSQVDKKVITSYVEPDMFTTVYIYGGVYWDIYTKIIYESGEIGYFYERNEEES